MPLMRTPQRAGAGEAPGGRGVGLSPPAPGMLQQGTLAIRNRKDRDGTARSGTAKDAGGRPWPGPSPLHLSFPITSLWDQNTR